MPELVEVIGLNGRIKRLEDANLVRRKGLLHKTVHVLVFNGAGELFLQKRGRRMQLFPSYWESSCSGKVEPGESFEEAAKRELKEELALQGVLRRLFDIRLHYKWRKLRIHEKIRVFKLITASKPRTAKGELSGGKWVSFDELREMVKNGEKVTTSLQRILKKLEKN